MIAKEITSLQHPIVKHLVKLRKNRRYRRESNSTLITGKKMIHELGPYKCLLLEKQEPLPPVEAEEIFCVSHEIMKKITGLESPEPIAAEIPLPPFQPLTGQRLLVLDGVSDPGNLGTLIRTALALGWDGAYLMPSSADPFNDKALRAAKGATFRLPLCETTWEELKTENRSVFVADMHGTPIHKIKEPIFPCFLVLGNESQGVKSDVKQFYISISIPISPKMESLNVATAGAILMHQLQADKR